MSFIRNDVTLCASIEPPKSISENFAHSLRINAAISLIRESKKVIAKMLLKINDP